MPTLGSRCGGSGVCIGLRILRPSRRLPQVAPVEVGQGTVHVVALLVVKRLVAVRVLFAGALVESLLLVKNAALFWFHSV